VPNLMAPNKVDTLIIYTDGACSGNPGPGTLDQLNSEREVTWKWVKGHAGIEGNERADELAREGIPKLS